ncbi:hypothetical protein KP509_21G041300 [Ceratopteris richardii]|nr:hypothetical protein KP509_21G041300 [Ceratopteris richardii]
MGKKFLGPPGDPAKRKAKARLHFSKAAQLLEKSHSSAGTPEAISLAKEADTEIDKAIALEPSDVSFHMLKSYALEQQGSLSGAIESLSAALSIDGADTVLTSPEMCDALFRRANLLLSTSKGRRNVDAAMSDLQRCIEISPQNPKILCKLGLCHEKNKSFADAERIYERVLLLDFKSQEARAGLKRLRP